MRDCCCCGAKAHLFLLVWVWAISGSWVGNERGDGGKFGGADLVLRRNAGQLIEARQCEGGGGGMSEKKRVVSGGG